MTTGDGEVTPGSTTTDSMLVINGTSNAFARIAVYDGSVQIGVTVAAADGNWSFDHTGVAFTGAFIRFRQAPAMATACPPP